jgi:hypothetical protein
LIRSFHFDPNASPVASAPLVDIARKEKQPYPGQNTLEGLALLCSITAQATWDSICEKPSKI